MIHKFIIGFAIIFLLLVPIARAQDPGMPGGPDYDPDKEVPLDGGIGVLLAVGLAYGVKKIKDMNRDSGPG